MKVLISSSLLTATALGYQHLDQRFKDSSSSIISDMGLAGLASHGCWCSKLGGKEITGSDTVDEVDALCKEWMMKRRCLDISGGACQDINADREYEISPSWGDNCSGTEACGEAACQVDNYYYQQIGGLISGLSDYPKNMNQGECGQVFPSRITNPICSGTAPNVAIVDDTSVAMPQSAITAVNNWQVTHTLSQRGGIYQFARVDEMYVLLTGQGIKVRSAVAPYDEITDMRKTSISDNVSEFRVYSVAYDRDQKLLIITGSYTIYVLSRGGDGNFSLVEKFNTNRNTLCGCTSIHVSQIEIDGDRVYFHVQSSGSGSIEFYQVESDKSLTHIKTTSEALDTVYERYVGMDFNGNNVVGFDSNTHMVWMYDRDGNLVDSFNVGHTRQMWAIKMVGTYIVIGAQSAADGTPELNLYDSDGNLLQTYDTTLDHARDGGTLVKDGNLLMVGQYAWSTDVNVVKLIDGALVAFGPNNGVANIGQRPTTLLIDTQDGAPATILTGNDSLPQIKFVKANP